MSISSAMSPAMESTTSADYRHRRRRPRPISSSHQERRERGHSPRLLACFIFLAQFVSSTTAWQPSKQQHGIFGPRTLVARRMVLTTPESIIEQASTQTLLDDLIDESVRTSARRPIIMQFDPSSGWIWKRWKGTIFSETWDSCVSKMVYACFVYAVFKTYPGSKAWFSGFNVLWGQLLSVTTFTLTFFVNQSYALWRKCYELSRRLQGRLHDLDMSLAAHAQRKPPTGPNEPSTYTAASRQILELVARYVRVFNLLTYASFTRSHRPILTPRGMRRLVERGLLTPQERQILVDAEVPATQRHNAVLLWIIRTFVEAREAGHFLGGAGFEDQFLEKAHVCRAQYGGIGDELQGRMPLAYTHLVQVLVDMILWMYPFMAVASGMSGFLTVVGTGLLTMSYQGLFDLAKQFLDPYDNESYGKGEDPLVVDTLIAETNAGSLRWIYGLEQYPVSQQKMKEAELSDYLLPVRGYSVEELHIMEEEKLQRERELQELRDKEEEERRLAEERERRVREAAEAMVFAQINTTSAVTDLLSGATFTAIKGSAVAPNFPGVIASVTPTQGETVAKLLDVMPVLKGDTVESLVPKATAPADPETLFVDESVIRPTLVGGATPDYNDDEPFAILEGVNGDDGQRYVHTFDAFDPYGDLPWFEEVGPDGKEIRMSQLLADEEWPEELEAREEEQTPIRTFEEFTQRVAELRDAHTNELIETAEIMMEQPGVQSSDMPLKDGSGLPPMYDQTKLDGFSQLWGLPPDELSEMPGYEEPPLINDGDVGGITQLWGGSIDDSRPVAAAAAYDDAEDDFGGISQLWGEDVEDNMESAASTRRIIKDDSDTPISPIPSETKEARMSQLLADEQWVEEKEPELAAKPPTFEDYKAAVNELIKAEMNEMLETQAILSAPPGADNLDVPEKDKDESVVVATNSTDADDDLAVLEMDESDDEELGPVAATEKHAVVEATEASTTAAEATGTDEMNLPPDPNGSDTKSTPEDEARDADSTDDHKDEYRM